MSFRFKGGFVSCLFVLRAFLNVFLWPVSVASSWRYDGGRGGACLTRFHCFGEDFFNPTHVSQHCFFLTSHLIAVDCLSVFNKRISMVCCWGTFGVF
jgi:hypothetical protein